MSSSNRKEREAASSTPTEYSSSMGSNYGMDGFFHDMDYGEGVLSPEVSPEYMVGMCVLPEDSLGDDESGFYPEELSSSSDVSLDSMWGSNIMEASLANLSWLESAHVDLDRLPSHPPYQVLPQLEEAWGSLTDGLSRWQADMTFVPNQDSRERDIDVSASQQSHWASVKEQIVKEAQRRSDLGDSLRSVFEFVAQSSGDRMSEFKDDLKHISEDHGLSGNVFVRASSYPRLTTSNVWRDRFRKQLKAQFILNDDGSLEEGSTYHGKEAVSSVPWSKAYKHHAKLLKATGRKLASDQHPKDALRAAFLSEVVVEVKPTEFPVHVTPSERITLAEAKKKASQHLASLKPIPEPVRSSNSDRLEKQVHAKVAKYLQSGRITEEQVSEARKQATSTRDFVARVAEFVAQNRSDSRDYSGDGQNVSYRYDPSYDHTWGQINASASKRSTPEERFVRTKIRTWMTEGFAGNQLNGLIQGSFSPDVRDRQVDLIKTARAQHEGLSGFLYVDAEAYASKTGTTGCDSGAIKHRSNGVKFVLAMNRCSSCAFANEDSVCSKYNKPLISSLPQGNVAGYQKDMIRLANSNDVERTASLFAPAYDPEEFDLQNDNLNGFEFESQVAETLASISFGEGMEITYEDE